MTFQEELTDLLDRKGMDEFKSKSFDEILLATAKPMLEKMLNAEMDEHLGYEKNQVSDSKNSRNGHSSKTVNGLFGSTKIGTPRDRNASFEPIVVKKNSSNISSVEEAIILLYAKENSTKDITEYIRKIYKLNLDPTSISRITDKILPDIQEFQTRRLEKTYAIIFIDEIRFKIREDGMSKEVSVYIPLGVNLEGKKEVLGYWIGESENDMKKIYKAVNINEAEKALENFEVKWSSKYGYATRSWRKNFNELVTFFEFPSEIRTLIYTANLVENLNRNTRKVSKNKSFPNMKSLSKAIYLAIKNQTKKWNLPIRNWGIIYNQLTILFDLKD